jgi:hypothetical protein
MVRSSARLPSPLISSAGAHWRLSQRLSLVFGTTSERYAWLTRSLFIARGRLRGANDIEYDVYRVR